MAPAGEIQPPSAAAPASHRRDEQERLRQRGVAPALDATDERAHARHRRGRHVALVEQARHADLPHAIEEPLGDEEQRHRHEQARVHRQIANQGIVVSARRPLHARRAGRAAPTSSPEAAGRAGRAAPYARRAPGDGADRRCRGGTPQPWRRSACARRVPNVALSAPADTPPPRRVSARPRRAQAFEREPAWALHSKILRCVSAACSS